MTGVRPVRRGSIRRGPQAAGTAAAAPPVRVAVVGAGAAGTLTALHLVRGARARGTLLEVVVVDPAAELGRGTAFGTTDDRHLLNVPAVGMSALPDRSQHFVEWRRQRGASVGNDLHVFAPRREYSRYLEDTLWEELRAAADTVRLEHRRAWVTGIEPVAPGSVATGSRPWRLVCHGARPVEADAFVVATGLPEAGTAWAPESLLRSSSFVVDPWAPGALEAVARDRRGLADVLVVGSGLTMVDVALTVLGRTARHDRRLTAVSRSGLLPGAHADRPLPAAVPDVTDWPHDLEGIVARATRHLHEVRDGAGDWRPAVDGLRFRVAELWSRLEEPERAEFLTRYAGPWGRLRHRMPPSSAARVDAFRAAGRLEVRADRVVDARCLGAGGVRVTLASGEVREVGWVVNCTGPALDVRASGNHLLADLLRPRPDGPLASAATAGMGLRTHGGRLLAADGGASAAPVWVLGALRRGELLESTAVPEIRVQAQQVAESLLGTFGPVPGRTAASAAAGREVGVAVATG
ncbi:unannotated protein [freshwater metagenome]|uniref:Unannotated protein n=1 Tax=freshwater metagenome TaxID=449393 RepID=A0A6J6U6H0_9ZZZZ|nr:oxidoreductase [Actinomycetota bacterium]